MKELPASTPSVAIEDLHLNVFLEKENISDCRPGEREGQTELSIKIFPYLGYKAPYDLGREMAICPDTLFNRHLVEIKCYLTESDKFYTCGFRSKNWNHLRGLVEKTPYSMCIDLRGKKEALPSFRPINFMVKEGRFFHIDSYLSDDFPLREINEPTLIFLPVNKRTREYRFKDENGEEKIVTVNNIMFSLESGFPYY